MGQQEGKLPSHPPRSHVLFIRRVPGRLGRCSQLLWMPSGSMQLLSLAPREHDKGPLFPPPALRLQLPAAPA